MKILAKQSCLLAAVLILACVIGRLALGNEFISYVPRPHYAQGAGSFSIVDTGEGQGKLDFEEPDIREDYIMIKARPAGPGEVVTEVRDDTGEAISVGVYRVDRFGNVFDYSSGGFTGDNIVMCALSIFFLVESLLFFRAFRRAKGPDFYAYSTIYTAGFSIFLLLTGILLTIGTLRHLLQPGDFKMINMYSQVSSAGINFMLFTSPFIIAFAAAMTVSNAALLRHERPRVQNALGILISLAMVVGMAVAFLAASADFSGPETEQRIRTTIQNVYCTAYAYFECMLIGAIVCGTKAARQVPAGDFDYIVILGCAFRRDGTLPPLLKGRVDRAISFWREQKARGKTAVLVPSGGQGENEVMPEAEAMARYLLSEGVPAESILPEMKSRNTYENMAFSKKLIEEAQPDARVLFSTTNYHVFRSGIWASLAGLRAEGIGSATKWWFWPNAYMRECAGLLVNRWKEEILLLVIFAVLFGGLSMLL